MTFLRPDVFLVFCRIFTLKKTFSLKKFYICVIDCTNAKSAAEEG
jgi:hypothetical protein